MKIWIVLLSLLLFAGYYTNAQSRREDIYSDFVLYNKRQALFKDLHENVIGKTFSLPIDSNTEYRYEAACRAMVQFMLNDAASRQGIDHMMTAYDSLQYDTKRALLEAVYGLYPAQYVQPIQRLLAKESNEVLFAMAAAYSFRHDTSVNNVNTIKIRMTEQFPGYDTVIILTELERYLNACTQYKALTLDQLTGLFAWQQVTKKKIIYSFQRHNRNYAGLAVVQNADGRFMRHPDGRLMVFEQLARSASALPYFIPDGNTPQGIYSIQGTAVSYNKLIGPTPNLQALLPFENKWTKWFHLADSVIWDSTQDALWSYQQLLPPSLRNIPAFTESFYAGKTGRRAIIAHGTTIDPEYFRNQPFYPLTPTMGCLCAKELWNITNGRLLVSEQFNLVSTFGATAGNKGYLYVIDIDDQQKPVNRGEVERWVKEYEMRNVK